MLIMYMSMDIENYNLFHLPAPCRDVGNPSIVANHTAGDVLVFDIKPAGGWA